MSSATIRLRAGNPVGPDPGDLSSPRLDAQTQRCGAALSERDQSELDKCSPRPAPNSQRNRRVQVLGMAGDKEHDAGCPF